MPKFRQILERKELNALSLLMIEFHPVHNFYEANKQKTNSVALSPRANYTD
jgi:hypothetical protein